MCLVVFCITGCASLPEEHEQSVNYARQARYNEALNFLETNKKSLYGQRDTVLYDLDEGVLRYYAGDYAGSVKQLDDAKKLIFSFYTKSITQEASSFIVNDTTVDYPGEDYEDVYANLFMSLSYYHQNKLDDALVEMNRFINKVQEISSHHEAELFKARKAANDSNQKPVTIEFHNSALGQYLSMLYHRASGDKDAAYADNHMLSDAFLTQKSLYPFPEPSSVGSELSVPKGKGRLNVIAFSGLAPAKYEEKTHFMEDYVLALPIMKKQPSPVGWIQVTVTDPATAENVSAPLEEIESIENIAMDTFKIRSSIIYSKAVARSLIKGTTTVASRVAGEQMRGNDDSNVAALGTMLELFSSVNRLSNELTESADLRTSRYFPARADVGGITLDPGIYDVSVSFYTAQGGTLLATRKYQGINVQPEKLALVEAACLGDKIEITPTVTSPQTVTAVPEKQETVASSPAVASEITFRKPFVFGLSAGLMTGGGSAWDSDYYASSFGTVTNKERLGGAVSLYGKWQGKKIGFRTGIDFVFNNGLTSEDSYTVLNKSYTDTGTITNSTIDIPALLTLDLPVSKLCISLLAGPYISIPFSINKTYTDEYNDTSDNIQFNTGGVNFGLTAGIGLTPPSGSGFIFNMQYNLDLTPTKGTYEGSDAVSLYTRRIWLFSIGYQF
jgi:uncharacterized protein